MEHIRVRNLRCIADTQTIKIKPMTLLVGANSSGKSSFLRVFPLLRQSAETRTLSGLLLNEGDVNFGFFNEAIHRDADPPELALKFGFTLRPGRYQGGAWNQFLIEPLPATCELTYAKRVKDPRYPSLRSVRMTLGSDSSPDTIEICADEDGKITKLSVNDFQANGESAQLRLLVRRGMVPVLTRSLDDKNGADSSVDVDVSEAGPFERLLLKETDVLFHGRTTTETRLSTLRSLRIGNAEKMLIAMKEIVGVASWRERVSHWVTGTPTFRKVRNLLLANVASELLSSMNVYVSQSARTVHYFQPVRASVQRDYLSRDVPVDNVDPSGLNVAMFLASLEEVAQRKFRHWMLKHFRFEVFPQRVGDGARIALRMKEAGSDTEFNLADMGFGFSQMLPFLVQIWSLVEFESVRRRFVFRQHLLMNAAVPLTYLIAIEQPELHLHPALQARIADLFVAMTKISRENSLPLSFMLETHSPTIVERIGQLVEANELRPEDVQVLLFERGRDGKGANTADVRTVAFDREGVLQDWPFGFLSPPPSPAYQPSPSTDRSSN